MDGGEVASCRLRHQRSSVAVLLLLDHRSYEGIVERNGEGLGGVGGGEPFLVSLVDQRLISG